MSKTANAAILYQREAFDAGGPKLMGRQAAGEGFLAGFARHAGVKRFIAHATTQKEFEHFRAFMQARAASKDLDGPATVSEWIAPGDDAGLARAGTLFVYAPALASYCWQRRSAGDAAWSVVGLTHTISSDRVMEDFGRLLTSPVMPWDALICTSSAVKRTVEGVLDAWGAWLGERLGAQNARLGAARPELPVIPLGVDCDVFPQGEAREKARAAARARMKLGAQDVAFLFLGRLSYHAKVHPLPMFLALEEIARRRKRKPVLILAGYFFNESIQRNFLDGAKRFCPSVRIIHVEGRDAAARAAAWAGADVFTSFSDNIQESFGLAPVEAMAAGLPAVVSDWDGYRDTVVHGETGLCVPTSMPEPGAGAQVAQRYLAGLDSYDNYIGNVSQFTAIDVGAAIEACEALIADPALRRKMGEAGRARARKVFDWSVVIPAYQALWQELGEKRRAAGAAAPASAYPLRDDPFSVFRAFPTRAIGAATRVALVAGSAPEARAEASRISASAMNNFAFGFLLRPEELDLLLGSLGPDGAKPVSELEGLFSPGRRSAFLRTLAWLAKAHIVRLTL